VEQNREERPAGRGGKGGGARVWEKKIDFWGPTEEHKLRLEKGAGKFQTKQGTAKWGNEIFLGRGGTRLVVMNWATGEKKRNANT